MRGEILLIANAYPSSSALYRNGFIHRRVKAYQDAGLPVSVFYHHEPVKESYTYKFDGVQVQVGNEKALEKLVSTEAFDAFLVHFAEPGRVRPLLNVGVKQPIIIWVHGFEAEPWYRRWFNFIESGSSLKSAFEKKESYYSGQNKFFHDIATLEGFDISFVNVSLWFQKFIVEPAIDCELANSVVIPNLIDENVFKYREKDPELRKRVLSIRPYASRKYANDQTVRAIIELSKRPFFKDLSFTICGEGPLFDSITRPLRAFANVNLVNSFFTQEEIAELHAEHGIFLSPTRFDSQGVSMGEAASSGLVTLTSDIAAVPEFFAHRDDALLAPPENFIALADFIEELYFDQELFERLSKAGSAKMKAKCGTAATVGAESQLIGLKVRDGGHNV